MSVTDADRIAAAGIPLTLGGREVRVRFTMRSWKEAEDRFGSLEEAFSILRRMSSLVPEEQLGKPIGPTMAFLWMALIHEGLTEDEVYYLCDIHDLLRYQAAILSALAEGTPGPGPGKDMGVVASPGPTTTTPSPSATGAVMATSGA